MNIVKLLIIASFFSSCGMYKQNIMFKTKKEYRTEALMAAATQADKNYVIQKNDFLAINVYTNKGEVIIDPNLELVKERGATNTVVVEKPKFIVQPDGCVRFPMIDPVKLEGYTLLQADSVLQLAYDKFYTDVFVKTKYLNKRVIVLGGSSSISGGKVIPLENENMNIIEILAIVGGIGNDARAGNIRLIRGDLKNPTVFIIDLRTIEGMRKANLKVEPGDIIYIEPVRRVALETLRDITPFLSFITTVLTLIVLINSNLNK